MIKRSKNRHPAPWAFRPVVDDAGLRNQALEESWRRSTSFLSGVLDGALYARRDLRRPLNILEAPDGTRARLGNVLSVIQSLWLDLWACTGNCMPRELLCDVLMLSEQTLLSQPQVRRAMVLVVELGLAVGDGAAWRAPGFGALAHYYDRCFQYEFDRLSWGRAREMRLLAELYHPRRCGLCGRALFGAVVLAERSADGKYEAAAACGTCCDASRPSSTDPAAAG